MGIPRAQELVIGCHSKVESTSEWNERIASCKPEKQNRQARIVVKFEIIQILIQLISVKIAKWPETI